MGTEQAKFEETSEGGKGIGGDIEASGCLGFHSGDPPANFMSKVKRLQEEEYLRIVRGVEDGYPMLFLCRCCLDWKRAGRGFPKRITRRNGTTAFLCERCWPR